MAIHLRTLLAFSLLANTGFADDKWEISTHMQVTGFPYAMPDHTQTVCTAPNEQSPTKMIPTEEGCTTSNIKTTGTTSSFHLECAPPKQMSGDVKITRLGNSSYKGEVNAQGVFDGQSHQIKITYTGKKLGSCSSSENTVNQANQIMAQQQALLAQQQAMQTSYMNMACQQVVTELNYQAAASITPMCPTIKTDVCNAFKQKSATPDGLRAIALQHEDWPNIANFCGMDSNQISASACNQAKQQQNWAAASDFCGEDSELEAIAIKQCTGVRFTALPANDPRRNYSPLCSRYAAKIPRTDSNGGVLDTGKKALDGVNKLRGVFGF